MLNADVLPLENELVRLRPLRSDDARAFAAGAGDAAVRRYGHLPEPEYTPESVSVMIEEQARPALERGELAVLAIADAETDEFAGSLVLFDVSDSSAEVGFWVHPEHRGRGVSASAIGLAEVFGRLSGLRVLRARSVPENAASHRSLTSAGFTPAGEQPGVTPSGVATVLRNYERRIGSAPSLPLATARLRLRAHRVSDAGPLLGIYAQPVVARYLLEDPWSESEAGVQTEERLAKTDLDGDAGALALIVEHEGEVAGDVTLWFTDREHRVAEIGWVLDPSFGGRGFAREAVAAVLDLAFAHYRVHRVAAQMDARNEASAKLAEAVGMTREAHLRQDWWSKGEWTDTLIYGVLAAEASHCARDRGSALPIVTNSSSPA